MNAIKTRWFVRAGFVALIMLPARPATALPVPAEEQISQVCSAGAVAENLLLAPTRMGDIPPDKLTEAQQEVAKEFTEARKNNIYGPYVALLRSPEVSLQMRRLGDYLQYKSALPDKLRQFVIVLIARAWTQQYM
jgi:hypothetical protein